MRVGPPELRRPDFMTLAMWLSWVLRPDLRGGAAIDDRRAQRDHAAWWLIAGNRSFPAVWWYGAAQVAVAMRPVLVPARLRLPRLLPRLAALWPDVGARFDLRDAEACRAYLAWYRVAGPRVLPAAPALSPALLALTEAPSGLPGWRIGSTGLPRVVVALATLHPPDPTAPLACHLDEAERRRLLDWFMANRSAAIPPPTPLPAGPEPLPRPGTAGGRPGGVNLIGFARAEMGIGEDVRSMSAALASARVPHCVVDTLPESGARLRDTRLAARIVAAPRYAVSVFCLTAADAGLLYLRQGPAAFNAGWRIGSWAWELPHFPPALAETLALVDEVWAHSRYSAAAFRAARRRPVRLAPPSVAAPSPARAPAGGRPPARRAARRFTCLYQFDPNSYLARKNPEAAILAFRMAFPPPDREARLVLRVNGRLEDWPDAAGILRQVAIDPRIVLRQGTMRRPAMLRLLAGADAFISPHRAEGFGRNIAEALLLGLPVLATGFSGSCDFLRPNERIRWRPRPVAPTEYPFAQGQYWAEPDVAHLARRLAALAAALRAGRGPRRAERRARAAALLRTHGTAAAGRRYRALLAPLFERAAAGGLRPRQTG